MNCANHPDRERFAFCQTCGKPLCRECARVVGQAVFCEPCLEARLAASAATNPNPQPPFQSANVGAGSTAGSASYQTVPGGGNAYTYTGTVEGVPYAVSGVQPPPGTPNPAVAAFLGLIPGVGAMYNGQYAKGLVHLIVFAVLVSLSDHNGFFGLFVAAWIFYQAFEAYHTAQARRAGTPLPNPFGLNDVGERFGFGRAWPSPHPTSADQVPQTPPPPPSSGSGFASSTPPPAASAQQPPAGDSSSSRSIVSPIPLAETYSSAWSTPPPATPFEPQPNTAPPPPFQQPLAAAPPQRSGLPIGALVLIALGILFLVGDTHWLGALPFYLLLPALIIGAGVWLFVRRMTAHGASFTDDGSAAYRLRLLSAVRTSIWVVLTGVLFLLDNLHILSWSRSWPLFIIVAGIVAFLQRSTAADIRRRAADDLPFSPAAAAGSPYTGTPHVTPENDR